MNEKETVSLFAPGSLGTCWYGKYHYLEPWVGCEHACPYCYARCRVSVRNSLEELATTFEKPRPILPPEELLRAISERVNSGDIDILKLSRFTDILTPSHVEDGLSYEILSLLCKSPIRRIILTTKGVPDERICRLFEEYREKVSYNAAMRPSAIVPGCCLAAFDANLHPVEERMDVAARMNRAGLKTTIHLDPFVAQIDDADEALFPFLDMLKERGLKRVMWSYLLFTDGIMAPISEAIPERELNDILARYDYTGARTILVNQNDTNSYVQRDDVALQSVDKVARALEREGFDFVLCSLKSIRGLDLRKYPRTMLCDGKFYA